MDPHEGLRALSAGLIEVAGRVDAATLDGGADGDSEPWTVLRGQRSMTAKHLAQSVKDGREVTFQLPDMDDVIGFVSGWDDLRGAMPYIFVVTFTPSGYDRTLVPLSDSTVIRIHSKSTSPKDETDLRFNDYKRVVQPFKTFVMNNLFPPRNSDSKSVTVNNR